MALDDEKFIPTHAAPMIKEIYQCCDGRRYECPFYFKLEVKTPEVSMHKEICIYNYRVNRASEKRC